MKNNLSRSLCFALSCALALLVFAVSSQAQTSTFTYQGNLTIGGTLANGSYDLQFKLYDQLSGGALQGSPNTVTVSSATVTAGVFTVELDFGAAAFSGAARFLEISVRPAGSGGFTTLSPRQQLSSTPYAIRSLSAASADTATTATSATSAANFSGSLSGDVTGTQGATVVSLVGGVTASNVASGATAANNATDANTPATIVKRDASGNFTAGTVTATNFSGGGASLTNLNASNITSGTLPDARLSSNVATLSGDQIFTGNKAFTGLNGLVATGMENGGSIPATGTGVRMMWYPNKYAFRAGKVVGTEWDDANVGIGSVAIGTNVKASFNFSVAMGIGSTASGNSSVAMGSNVTASGSQSIALGFLSTASGQASVAIGESNQASGNYSVALGKFASTNGKQGSFVFNDSASNTIFSASQNNQFNVRAAGGLRFFASNDTSDDTKPGLFISGTTGDTQINGNLSVSGTLSANVAGTATSATNFTGSLTGDVTGTQSATVVSAVGGMSASNVASGATAANNATDANTANAIVKRDAAGNFTAGTIAASAFSGGGASLTSLNASNIVSGTLPDARLSSNVATLTADQTFTGNKFFSGANGLLATGTFGSGSIPATGEGTRMMWYPKKAAFRAGNVDNFGSTSWDDANVGEYSVAMGFGTKASGQSSTALGTRTTASGDGSVAMGRITTASGFASTALGSLASTNGKEGSFVYGDNSTISTISATANHQFNVRAAGGLRFFASNDTSDETKPGLFVSGATGNTQINGNLTVTGTITGTVNANVTSATNFTGSLSGDVTGTQSATVVSSVGGVTASNVASGTTLANNATDANTASAIVKRDASGNFSAGTITATSFSGSGAGLTGLSASNLTSGTLLDSLLSSNVAKLTGDQTFTGNKIFSGANGLLATGAQGSGAIPATGAGVRMMWYPNKYAFRAGQTSGTEWDDDNTGYGSVAFGDMVKASNFNSVAMGFGTVSSGISAVAMGNNVTASGFYAVGIGSQSTASGNNSVALGESNQASGNNSVALGRFASTNSKSGSFVFNDVASNNTLAATADNQFSVRATGGLRLFASTDTSDTTKPGLFISGTTGDTQINGNLTVSGAFSGSGSGLTSLSATNINSGTLADARLSSNVALKSAANTFTADQTVNANLIQDGSLIQFTPTDGFVAKGQFNTGSIPATGNGVRMMWYPGKAAFRAGRVGNTQWEDENIGDHSVAMGQNPTASGIHSVAFGQTATASGNHSIAFGNNTTVSGDYSFAAGSDSTASGIRSTALGYQTTASGDYSTAIGRHASTGGYTGAFVYGDNSSSSDLTATANSQFVVRAQNMWFGTNNSVTATSGRFLETSTGAYLTTGGTWTNSSSRALKTNFAPVNARATLQKVLQLPIQTWSYKAEGANVRHIGAISQDFNRLFGFGDSAETIATVDADGVAMAAIQGLHEELKDRDTKIEQQQQALGQLQQQVKQQQAVIEGLRQLLCAQQPQAPICQPKERK